MEDKIQFIRQKCIETNPSKFGGKEMVCTECKREVITSGSIIVREKPVRLADVLLAIRHSPECDTNWEYEVTSDLAWKHWNLSKDSLSSQSPETIEFIFNLLQ